MPTPFVKTDYPPSPAPATDVAGHGGYIQDGAATAPPLAVGMVNAVNGNRGVESNASGVVGADGRAPVP